MENINKYNKYKSNIAKYKQIMSYVENLFSNYMTGFAWNYMILFMHYLWISQKPLIISIMTC